MIVERLVRRGMGGRGHGQRLHAAKESDSGDGDGDSLDPGAIVVLNELIIGERKNAFFSFLCVTSVYINLSGLHINALNSENIRKEHCQRNVSRR